MKHFLSALALGCLLLSCNRDLENNETPAPQNEKSYRRYEKMLVRGRSIPLYMYFNYKNGNEIESFDLDYVFNPWSSDKVKVSYEYDVYGRIIKEHRSGNLYKTKTNIVYQYDGLGRLISSHAISSTMTPTCSVERKHTYTYQGNKVIVKMEQFTSACSSEPEEREEKTMSLLIENGRVTKSFDEQGNMIETIEYYDTKNALRDIKGYTALVSEFYLRDKFAYDLIGYGNDIEYFSDLRFIDNVKTRGPIFGDGYLLYQYLDHDRNEYNGDYPEVVRIVKKSYNNPTNESEWDWHERYYIEEK